MRDSEGKGYIKEGIDGREMGWRQLQMCGYSFTLRQTISLSLSLLPFFFYFLVYVSIYSVCYGEMGIRFKVYGWHWTPFFPCF